MAKKRARAGPKRAAVARSSSGAAADASAKPKLDDGYGRPPREEQTFVPQLY